MKKYLAYGTVVGTVFIGEFEAESEEEAREMAENHDKAQAPTLCHYCSDEIDLGDMGEIEVCESPSKEASQ